MARVVLLYFCAASAGASRFNDSAMLSVSGNSSRVSGACAVATIKNVCVCDHKSFWNGYQCSGCKDKMKWGYGCDLDCPSDCEKGCDFSGNCLSDGPTARKNCKRTERVKKKTPKSVVTNERSECQACKAGFYGLMCEHSCPQNCADTAEGICTRGGKCYECKDGWYGQDCTSECPPGCPSCVMMDNLTADKDAPGDFLPAGHCNMQCKTDTWGPTCNNPCPKNCKDMGKGKASCAKDTGICKKCQDSRWYGPNCEQDCSEGCVDGRCEKANGRCEDGCKPGVWGSKCAEACPEKTVGACDRNTGLPHECKEGSYPKMNLTADVAECETCPIGCKNGKCYKDGTCSEGCKLGKFGNHCDEACPVTCIGACDAAMTGYNDGECTKCTDGFTGSKCEKLCHSMCATCKQRGRKATGPDGCTSCPADQATFLVGSKCECIEGASRDEKGLCQCDNPVDPDKDAFFELKPRKLCRGICRDGTREVFGDKESTCMTHKKYKAVIRAEDTDLEQGDCAEDEWEIPIPDSDSECIRKDFVSNILEG